MAAGLLTLAVACGPDAVTDGPVDADDVPPLGAAAEKPEVALPDAAPDDLVVEDLVVGEGDVVAPGDTVTIHLVAVALSSGTQVDSTWELAAPRRVPLRAGGAVDGLIRGLDGARVGGRRHLVVPPDLAYGAAGAPPMVAPGETLVLVVDVLGVERAG